MIEQYSVYVSEVIKATPTVFLIRLKFKDRVDFNFKPGQYIFVNLKKDERPLMKPYSIASSPSKKDYIELCIKRVEGGYVSTKLSEMKAGVELKIFGPIGSFVLREPLRNDVVFVATGSGISAIKPMIDTIFEKGTDKNIWLFFGNRTEDEIIYRKEFENYATEFRNFHFIPIISRPEGNWKGEVGHVQEPLQKIITNPDGMEIYLCGVLAMVEEVKVIAEKMGFEKNKIYFEKYV